MLPVDKCSLILVVRFEHLPGLTRGLVSNVWFSCVGALNPSLYSLVFGFSFSDLYININIKFTNSHIEIEHIDVIGIE